MWGNCWSPLGTIRLPRWLGGRESTCSVGDVGSIPGSGRCPGEGDGNPLQCPCLENPTDRGARPATVHGVGNSLTQFSGWACIGFTSLSGFTWGENRERLSACVERSPQEQGGCSEHEHQPWTGRLAAAAGVQAGSGGYHRVQSTAHGSRATQDSWCAMCLLIQQILQPQCSVSYYGYNDKPDRQGYCLLTSNAMRIRVSPRKQRSEEIIARPELFVHKWG